MFNLFADDIKTPKISFPYPPGYFLSCLTGWTKILLISMFLYHVSVFLQRCQSEKHNNNNQKLKQ